jgi:DNA (cytosine-5)-methyltransferase 1
VGEPLPTVASAGAIGLIEPFIVEYYGTGGASGIDEPVATVTTKDRFGLVRPTLLIKGKRYLLDIGFRMLQPHELAAAQGFPADYAFQGTKTEVVKQIGNAVPCGLARALVAAALKNS